MENTTNLALVKLFLALQISGASAFALILLSACISRGGIKRHPIWFSFCISWVVFGFSFSLLLFAGQQYTKPERGVCIAQAAFIYGAPLLVASTSLGLIIHLLLSVLSALTVQSQKAKSYRVLMNILVVFPWLLWLGVFVGVFIFSLKHGDLVIMSPNGTFCTIQYIAIPKITSISVILASISILGAEFAIGIVLYRNRAIVDIFDQSMTMAIRLLIFTILGFATLSVGLVFAVTRSRGVAFDIIISALPPSAAVIFGTQRDLLRGWMFWKKHAAPEATDQRERPSLIIVESVPSRMTTPAGLPVASSGWPVFSPPATPPPPPRSPLTTSSFLHF